MSRVWPAVAVALAVLGLVHGAVRHWRDAGRGAVQRGFEVAQTRGCFTCHGPGGLRGMANPGHGDEEVPALAGGLVDLYARDRAELREWIEDGLPRRFRDDPARMAQRRAAVIRMPAFGKLLSASELSDLLAYVAAVADLERPDDARAEQGRLLARQYGCFNCHGPQGRGAPANPGSRKGYIPPWDGPDFLDLVRDDVELREWILDGQPRRLGESVAARHFRERQPVKMPAYRQHIPGPEVDLLVVYIRWVRGSPAFVDMRRTALLAFAVP